MRTCEIDDVDFGSEPFDAGKPARRSHVVELCLEQRIVAPAAFRPEGFNQHFERKVLVR